MRCLTTEEMLLGYHPNQMVIASVTKLRTRSRVSWNAQKTNFRQGGGFEKLLPPLAMRGIWLRMRGLVRSYVTLAIKKTMSIDGMVCIHSNIKPRPRCWGQRWSLKSQSSFSQLTWLVTQDNFTDFSLRESFIHFYLGLCLPDCQFFWSKR
jgi:hypothetical protein